MHKLRLGTAYVLLMGIFLWAAPAASAGVLDDLTWTEVDNRINGIVYDSHSGLLFATLAATDADYGNKLVAFHPDTLDVEWSVAVGSEPDAVVVSDDGSTVYVGLDGSDSIARVDVASRTVVDTFALPSDYYSGPMEAEDIAVAPGNPDLIAVSLEKVNSSPRHGGVAIFDNGTLLPDVTPDHTGSNSIEFGAAPTVLYGQNTETTEFGFRRMTVSATGVTVDDVTRSLAGYSFYNTFTYQAGLAYFKRGAVVDPTVPSVVGTYASSATIDALVPIPSLGMTMTLTGTGTSNIDAISVFDIDGYNLLDTVEISHSLGYTTGEATAIDDVGMAVVYSEGLLIAGLFPGGWIHGTVTDSVTAEPISEVCVFATDEQTRIVGQTETIADGRYAMRVLPGTWRILFGDCHYVDYFWEWHNNRVFYDFDKATPVTMSDGGTVTINAAMRKSFTDSLGNLFQEQIWWMYDTGITTGCGDEAYCPDSTVTRGQMAAFLTRALGLTATSSIDFTDDDGNIFEGDINKLATAGITKGCNPPANTMFCPDDPVTRGQMAAFLVRALDLTATSNIDFTDDDGNVFEDNINRLATAGITKGCNPPDNTMFCPHDFVTRGQMAAFLNRALADDYTLVLPATDPPMFKAPTPSPFGPTR